MLGISRTVVTPPSAAAAVPVAKSSLSRHAGIAEMHVHVHETGQYVHSGRIDDASAHPVPRSAGPAAQRSARRDLSRNIRLGDGGDASVAHYHVAHEDPVRRDDGSAAYDQVGMHVAFSLFSAGRPPSAQRPTFSRPPAGPPAPGASFPAVSDSGGFRRQPRSLPLHDHGAEQQQRPHDDKDGRAAEKVGHDAGEQGRHEAAHRGGRRLQAEGADRGNPRRPAA